VGFEPLGKFSTLLYFSTGYQTCMLRCHDPFCRVLNMQLLQFYYSGARVNKTGGADNPQGLVLRIPILSACLTNSANESALIFRIRWLR
jgi:hypothetical protein